MRARTTKVTDVLSRDQIKRLLTPTNREGFTSLLFSWGLIALCFLAAARFPHPATYVAVVLVLGGRQLALAILMHECAHRSLFRSKGLNDFVGNWLCGAPTWNRFLGYREHHRRHHHYTNTEKDVDLGLVTPFPTSRASMMRKFARDLTGIAGVRRIFGLLAMDLGFITYTASYGAEKIDQKTMTLSRRFGIISKFLGPVILTNLALFGILAAAGHPMLYLLWVVSWLTTYGFFLRIRAIAEHACTDISPDPLRNTRTTKAGPIARLFFAPHDVNYHLEHHLLPTVPHYRLKLMHQMLTESGALKDAYVANGYREVMRAVSAA